MSSEYLKARAIEREEYWHKQATAELEKEIRRYYLESLAAIEKEVSALYGRFADENGLSPEQARKLIRGDEYRQWRMSLREYIEAAKKDRSVLRELNTLAMRSRITRLEKLLAETFKELDRLCDKANDFTTAFLMRAYYDNYYKSLYDLHKEVGLKTPPVAVDSERVGRAIKQAWSGATYSARIWRNGEKLAQSLRQALTSAVHRGLSVKKLSRELSRAMDVGYNNAERLVRTELNYVQNAAALDSIKAAELDHYQYLAALDRRTCSRCGSLDGQIFEVEEKEQGLNAPPLHPRCRCTICAALGESLPVKRRSRIAEGRVKVDGSITYEKWKARYVEVPSGNSDGLKNEIDKFRQEYKKQKANGASADALEKTIKAAGRMTLAEVKKIKFYEIPPNEKIDVDLLLKTRNNFVAKANEIYSTLSNVERQKLVDVYHDIEREYRDFKKLANEQRLTVYERRTEQVKKVFSRIREMGATEQQVQMHFGNSKSQIRSAAEKALNCYPREWVELSAGRGSLKLRKVKRGFYDDTSGELAISSEGGFAYETAIHELGHRMECVLPDILSAEKEFYSRRTNGDKLETLNQAAGYCATERTRKDKFIDAYMGKDYGGIAYELVSMGFQYVFTNPEKLLLDEDMAEWVFGILAVV